MFKKYIWYRLLSSKKGRLLWRLLVKLLKPFQQFLFCLQYSCGHSQWQREFFFESIKTKKYIKRFNYNCFSAFRYTEFDVETEQVALNYQQSFSSTAWSFATLFQMLTLDRWLQILSVNKFIFSWKLNFNFCFFIKSRQSFKKW